MIDWYHVKAQIEIINERRIELLSKLHQNAGLEPQERVELNSLQARIEELIPSVSPEAEAKIADMRERLDEIRADQWPA